MLALTGWTLLFGAACGGSDPTDPQPAAPQITVEGVEVGAVYTEPVTITIQVDRGGYEAVLDGETFYSGRTVSSPGEHRLEVVARNGTATSELEVPFTIALGGSSVLIVRLLDLGANDAGGGGDAILITDSSAAGVSHGLVDAGPAGDNGSDAGFVARRLLQLGVDTLAFMILSHAHSDHYAGMVDVLRSVHVRRFIYNGQTRSTFGYQRVLSEAAQRAGEVIATDSVMRLPLAGYDEAAVLAVLPALDTYLERDTNDGRELNEGSVGGRLAKGSFEMFLTGDGELEANRQWRNVYAEYSRDVEVLKAGHHGSNDAVFDPLGGSQTPWLSHTDPDVIVISANGTSHPRRGAINAFLGRSGTDVFCTHVHGTVEIRVAPSGQFAVSESRGEGEPCTAGSEAQS